LRVGHLHTCLMVTAAVALAGIRSAQAHRWPDPPAWWLHSSFAQCVRIRESGNGRGSSNIYGMLEGWQAAGGHGNAKDASRAEQDYRAWILYRRYGTAPWRPYDGC